MMYHLYAKKIILIVTGVTGLLRAFSPPRNSVYALSHNTFRHLVTAVTGFFTRAHGKNFSFLNLIILNHLKKILTREVFYPVTPLTLVTIIDF